MYMGENKDKNKYDKWFTLLLYISLSIDVVTWVLSSTEGFLISFMVATSVFVLFFFVFYLLFMKTRNLFKEKNEEGVWVVNEEKTLFLKFVYFMSLKLFLFFFNFLPIISGLIFVVGVGIISITLINFLPNKAKIKWKDVWSKFEIYWGYLIGLLILVGATFLILYSIQILYLIFVAIAILALLYGLINIKKYFRKNLILVGIMICLLLVFFISLTITTVISML